MYLSLSSVNIKLTSRDMILIISAARMAVHNESIVQSFMMLPTIKRTIPLMTKVKRPSVSTLNGRVSTRSKGLMVMLKRPRKAAPTMIIHTDVMSNPGSIYAAKNMPSDSINHLRMIIAMIPPA